MPLFADWFITKKGQTNEAILWLLKEDKKKREQVIDAFCETVRSHYDDLKKIADDIAALGYVNAAIILGEQLPLTKRARSGELGEIMASANKPGELHRKKRLVIEIGLFLTKHNSNYFKL